VGKGKFLCEKKRGKDSYRGVNSSNRVCLGLIKKMEGKERKGGERFGQSLMLWERRTTQKIGNRETGWVGGGFPSQKGKSKGGGSWYRGERSWGGKNVKRERTKKKKKQSG